MINLTPELQAAQDDMSLQNEATSPVMPVADAPADANALADSAARQQSAPIPVKTDDSVSSSGATFRNKLATAANKIGVPPTVGGWAQSLIASAMSALGNAGDIDTTPGGGALAGIAGTMRNRSERLRQNQLDQQKQAQIDAQEKRQDTQLDLEKQKTAAYIAEAQTHEHASARISRNADSEYQQKAYDHAQMSAAPFKEAGAPDLGHNLTSDEMQQMIQDKKLDPTQTHAFVDGYQPVTGSDGNPVIGKDGLPMQRATWQLLGPVEEVRLSKPQADFLTKYGGQDVKEGQKLPGEAYYLMTKRAAALATVQNNADHVKAEVAQEQSAAERNRAETREKNLTIQDKIQNNQAAKDFSPYLAQANGDAVIGMQLMASDPKGKSKLGGVEKLYGPGNIERIRQNSISDLLKTISEGEKVLNEHSIPGATPLPADEEQDLRDEIKAARQQRNTYLGVHKNDPDQIAASVVALDKVPASQRAALINSSTAMSQAAKIYLLKHYNLVAPAQPAPTR